MCQVIQFVSVSLLQPFKESGGMSKVTELVGVKDRGCVCLTLNP